MHHANILPICKTTLHTQPESYSKNAEGTKETEYNTQYNNKKYAVYQGCQFRCAEDKITHTINNIKNTT